MSLYRINEVEQGKIKKLKKVISLQPVHHNIHNPPVHPNCTISISNNINKHGDNVRERPDPNPRLHACPAATTGHMGDGKLPPWHYLMEQAFENFLMQLDDIFLTLRKKESTYERYPDLKSYQDICVKLRTEILIATDKLELLSMADTDRNAGHPEFFHKMSHLKTQLSELRWLYHNAIKDLGTK